jgi:hypothetical protein
LPIIFRVLFYHFLQSHSVVRSSEETELDRKTVRNIFWFAALAIHFMECLERAEVPLGTRPMLEQEIDWVQDAI